ncbi:hypothetical protein K2X33_10445, partial [bacterium]|nr:hypothetical protein [bacterium]
MKGDPRRPLRQLFKQPSHSMKELEQNCGKVFKKKNFGLIVTNAHATHPGVWDAVTAFLQDARGTIDFPVPRNFMDLFYGRYSNKFTGLHKDTQDIFAFVALGKKRMLAWPFEYLLGKVKGIAPGDKYFNKRLPIDYRKFRKDAVVLDAQAGDMIYWPGDHWHVAEPVDKVFSCMLSLGVLRQELRSPGAGESPLLRKFLSVNPHAGQREQEALVSQEMTEVVPWEDAERQLRWLSGYGFEQGGPMADAPKGKLKQPITVSRNPNGLVLWVRNKELKQLMVSSTGHVIALPEIPECVAMLEKLAAGKPFTVAEDPKRSVDGGKIIESYWSKDGEAKTRKLASNRDLVSWLAQWLLRVGAAQ